jgi:PAS domain S-box-containing protein
MTLARGDGTTLVAEVFMGAAFGDNGASPLSTTIVRDLAAHKAAEVELEEYRHRLEDLLKERAAEMREAAARVRREADERQLAEAETQATERRFQVLVERSSDVILVLDDTDHVSYCSPSVERLMGYRQDEITGMVVDKFIHSDDLVNVEAVRRGLRAKSPAEFQAGTLRVHTKDGSLRWLEWSVSGHYDDDAIHGSVVNARDVTERVLAERSLRDSEERYRTLTEASPDMIVLVGADGRVQYVNGQAAQRFGASADKLVGRPLAEIFDGPEASKIATAVERVLESGEPFEAESTVPYPDGDRWVSTRLVALKDNGRVSGVLGVSHDVTEHRLALNALAESERRYRSLFEDSPVAMWEED